MMRPRLAEAMVPQLLPVVVDVGDALAVRELFRLEGLTQERKAASR